MAATVDKNLVKEFSDRLEKIENEMELLKSDRKDLFLEYKSKLDVKAFKAALQIVKIRSKVDNHSTLEDIMGLLEGDFDD